MQLVLRKLHVFPADYPKASKFTVDGNDIEGGSEQFNRTGDEFPVPAPQTWGSWSSWTDCSRSCASGRQARMRECITEGQSTLDCVGDRVQIRTCNTHPCPGACDVEIIFKTSILHYSLTSP